MFIGSRGHGGRLAVKKGIDSQPDVGGGVRGSDVAAQSKDEEDVGKTLEARSSRLHYTLTPAHGVSGEERWMFQWATSSSNDDPNKY